MISEIFSPGEDGTGSTLWFFIAPEAHDDRGGLAHVAASGDRIAVAAFDQPVHDRLGQHAQGIGGMG